MHLCTVTPNNKQRERRGERERRKEGGRQGKGEKREEEGAGVAGGGRTDRSTRALFKP